MVTPNLNVVQDRPQYDVINDEPEDHKSSVAVDAMMLALKALSQKTIIALSRLFSLLTAGSVFALWMSIPDPNTNQIVWAALYAAFIIALNVIVERR